MYVKALIKIICIYKMLKFSFFINIALFWRFAISYYTYINSKMKMNIGHGQVQLYLHNKRLIIHLKWQDIDNLLTLVNIEINEVFDFAKYATNNHWFSLQSYSNNHLLISYIQWTRFNFYQNVQKICIFYCSVDSCFGSGQRDQESCPDGILWSPRALFIFIIYGCNQVK